MRHLFLAAPLLLAACAAGTTSPTTQSAAQQLQTHWPQVSATVGLALLADGASAASTKGAMTALSGLETQMNACASGSDPTCMSTFKPALMAYLGGLKLGPKGQDELLIAEGFLPASFWAVPPAPVAP